MKYLPLILIPLSLNVFSQSSDERRDALIISALSKASHALAQLDLSCSQASDCAIIPMGAKPCGGPSSYVVTSKNHRHLQDIENLAERVSEKEEEFNRRYGRVSDCSIQNPPAVECVRNTCSTLRHQTSAEASSDLVQLP